MGYLPSEGLIVRLPKVVGDPAFEVAPVPAAATLFPVFLAAKALWTWQQTERPPARRPGPRRVA